MEHCDASAELGRPADRGRCRRRAGHCHLPHSYCFHAEALPDSTLMKRTPSLFLALSLAAIAAVAQNPQPPAGAAIPTVKFDVFWEPATPQQYTITVQATAETKYVSHNPTKPADANGVQADDFETQFTLSPPTPAKLFAMADQ